MGIAGAMLGADGCLVPEYRLHLRPNAVDADSAAVRDNFGILVARRRIKLAQRRLPSGDDALRLLSDQQVQLPPAAGVSDACRSLRGHGERGAGALLASVWHRPPAA